jgi:hypothetical protein
MSDDQKPLRDDEREKLARDLTDSELERTPRVTSPLAVLTAGQPGSGKSMIVTSMRVKFGDARAVEINPDEVRPQIPYMRERIERGDLNIPGAAFSDAGTVAARIMEMSSAESRNIIYDGTLSNSFYAGKTADHLKEQGYRVEVHGMAVTPDLSHASTYDRREGEIRTSPTGFGRGVGDDFHDQAVKGLVQTIGDLQAQNKVDAIVLYDRDGQIVGSSKFEKGEWVPDQRMAETLREVHNNPNQKSLQDAANTWDRAAELMRYRGAEPGEQQKVDGFRDAALARVVTDPKAHSVDADDRAKGSPVADTPNKSEIPAPMQQSNVERDRAVEIAPVLAQHENQRENIEELRERAANSTQRTGNTTERAEPGETYRGKIVAVTTEHVLQQREDRANVVIQHDRVALSGAVREGRNMEISYPHGKAGLVSEITPNRENDRQRENQNDRQHDRGQAEAERD